MSSSTFVTLTSMGTTETLASVTSAAELSSSTEILSITTFRESIRTEECAALGGAGHDLSDDKLAEVKIQAYDDKTLDECLDRKDTCANPGWGLDGDPNTLEQRLARQLCELLRALQGDRGLRHAYVQPRRAALRTMVRLIGADQVRNCA
ncbi:hypothetical protein N0V84_009740 [Fusarium piperis]|uniref:Uncharacterized protein n=1 Tax=Fusarium piperis TaxID=1435070 RepID=A0A9W8W5Q6_9HYPO|nr:hypothetical protein N0V84_009740 [Fusarium piperis]